MSFVKVAIYDEDERYVTKLANYLSKNRKESIRVMGYTIKDVAKSDIVDKKTEVVISTDLRFILDLRKEKEAIKGIWLTKEKKRTKLEEQNEIIVIYQYDSAKVIKDKLEEIIRKKQQCIGERRPFIGVYSPVGRCGKTTFSMDIVENEGYKKWLYIGMEDYNSFELLEKEEPFLYYLKERNKGKILEHMEEKNGIIPSAISFLDTKQIDLDDLEWLRRVIEKDTTYEGVLFDIGTGMVNSMLFLIWFDYLIVPYLEEKRQEDKVKNLCEFIKALNMEECLEHFYFINMGNQREIKLMQDKVGFGQFEPT